MSDPTFRAGFDAALETTINTALQYDPATRQRLSTLDGKAMALDLTAPKLQCCLCIEGDQVRVRQQWEGEVSTHLGGSALAFVRLIKDPDATPAGLGVSVSGSSALLAELQWILSGLDIDWEAPLAEVIGDIPAHSIGGVLRDAARWLGDNLNRAPVMAAEAISEEWQLTPPQAQFEAFVDDLAEVSLATERLEARVRLLQEQFSRREAE
ncbi:SCP2 sterol-binding domain-containing protein [Microbulbifer sp. OS29]|uniref:Ubiquinone biosynthesis accessory factor UbiJ n=1 Tax=Microbulbifer okhotskensis TaxID=2926617 RepID=A0A9X2EIK8_9GAMM|nr:SCP2 sterol-binding domain-containing protein [Microbulbifer okhotskensis]MCO1332897.1 SCP2 sterol-binding domain-containing protein [Microbulbifer okhotskensis]